MKETILAAASSSGDDISWPWVAVMAIIAAALCFIVWAGGRD